MKTQLLTMAKCSLLVIFFLTVYETVYCQSTIAHWDFNEGSGTILNDISGNGHDGTVTNATWGSGYLCFDGQSSNVEVPYSPDFSNLTNLTVNARFKVTSLPDLNNYGVIVAVFDQFNGFCNSTNQAFRLSLHQTSNGTMLQFTVRTGSNTVFDGTGVYHTFDNFPMDEFIDITGIAENGHYFIYMNGSLLAENDMYSSAIIKEAVTPLTIGYSIGTNNDNDPLNTYFEGWIDEVEIMNDAIHPSIENIIITKQPHSQIGYISGLNIFTVEATGYQPLLYQWFKDDEILIGSNSNQLFINNISFLDEGQYYCKISNQYHEINSTVANFTVMEIPEFSKAVIRPPYYSMDEHADQKYSRKQFSNDQFVTKIVLCLSEGSSPIHNVELTAKLNEDFLHLNLNNEYIEYDNLPDQGDGKIDEINHEEIVIIANKEMDESIKNAPLSVAINSIDNCIINIPLASESISYYRSINRNSDENKYGEPFNILADSYQFETINMPWYKMLQILAIVKFSNLIPLNYLAKTIWYGGGQCYGMAASSGAYFKNTATKPIPESLVHSWEPTEPEVRTNICLFHIEQAKHQYPLWNNESEYNKLFNQMQSSNPSVLMIKNKPRDKHAILATGISIYNNQELAAIDVYENKFPDCKYQCKYEIDTKEFSYFFIYNKFQTQPQSIFDYPALDEIHEFLKKDFRINITSETYPDKEVISAGCPINMMVKNAHGKLAGYSENGKKFNEIDQAEVYRIPTYNFPNDSITYIVLPKDEYTVNINSYGEGIFRFEYLKPISDSNLYSSILDSIQIYRNSNIYFNNNHPSCLSVDIDGDYIVDYKLNTYENPSPHIIDLPQGWSSLSSYLEPVPADLPTVMQPVIEDLEFMINPENKVYMPRIGMNQIGDWNSHHGYKVLMSDPGQLRIIGLEEEDKTVPLRPVLNFIPVLSKTKVACTDLFDPLGNTFILAKEFMGNRIYCPMFYIFKLDSLEPGKAYDVYVNNYCSITFPETDNVFSNPVQLSGLDYINTTYWNDVTYTGLSHSVLIAADALKMINEGDFIGVFDQTGRCNGMAEVTKKDDYGISVSVQGDDETTEELKDGFIEEEWMSFKLFKSENRSTYDLKPVFNKKSPSQDKFVNHGITVIDAFENLTSLSEFDDQGFVYVYPNPASKSFNIAVNNQHLQEITVYNLEGKQVLTRSFDTQQNIYSLETENFPPGIYLLKLVFGDSVVMKKIGVQ